MPRSDRTASFGPFEVDFGSGEVRKHGYKVRLQEKPFQVLTILLERSGQVIPRQELRLALWPQNHFVEFDHNLNNAINKLREALGDSSEKPSYLETVPRRGYRFIAAVSWSNPENAEPSADELPASRPVSKVAYLRWSAWLAVAVAAATMALLAFHPWRTRPRLQFQPHDWVLITNFDNRTGEALLDGTLEYALERELSNSRFVSVAPRERIEDTLRLMRKPLDTKIDAALGREICLRDGGIRALLTGRVEKLGSTYVLSAQIVDPVRDVAVASLSQEDPAESELAATVRRLSDRVRETLGEKASVIKESDQRLEKVTTPSLHALQLYTQANALVTDKDAEAAELLERAIADDPNFASAHLLLGYAYSNFGNYSKAKPHFQRAYELADSTSDRERLFIVASYDEMVLQNRTKAIQDYEILLRLCPDHFWGTNNLVGLYNEIGNKHAAGQLEVSFAKLAPNSFASSANAVDYLNAIYYLSVDQKSSALAAPLLQRATAALAAEPPGVDDWVKPATELWLRLFPAIQAWLNDDAQNVDTEIKRVENAQFQRDAVVYPVALGIFHMTLGQLNKARRWFEAIQDPAWRNGYLAHLAFIQDDTPALRENVEYFREHRELSPMIALSIPMLLRAGYVTDAQRMTRTWLREDGASRAVTADLGEIALAQGEHEKGTHLIEQAIAKAPGRAIYFLAAESLARQYQRRGDLGSAVRTLEQMSTHRPELCSPPALGGCYGVYWMRTQFQLAQLYRELGRVQDAENIEEELRKLLAYADPDFPMLVELNRLQDSTTLARKSN